MKGEWCYYKNHLPSSVCDYIIENVKKIPEVDGKVGFDEEVNLETRKSKIRFIKKDNEQFEFLFDILWKTAIEANDLWFGFHISKLDYIQFAEYDEKDAGEYKMHRDVFWMNSDPVYHRKLSCVVQLTDPSEYEGCDLELYNTRNVPDKKEIKEKGSIVYFPSFVDHAATPITKGTRYSLAAWFDGPKWR